MLLTVDPTWVRINAPPPVFSPSWPETGVGPRIKTEFGFPIIKMIPIETSADLAACAQWDGVADWLIFDAKVAKGTQPGGTGHRFDWAILSHYQGSTPWMLAGGLTIDTVAEASKQLVALAPLMYQAGSSTSAEKKDENKIHDFIRAAQIG
ncbi:MAG: hypothetical protein CM15mP46_4550 [Alphaproteobacteria bacterium]|nr:MAG: hypothetical protein CM15mP46_4550 [Alphaproteobacteria bacterium]